MNRRNFLQILAGTVAAIAVEQVVKPVYFDFGRNQKPKLRSSWDDLHKNPDWFETSIVYAPYIPLFVTPNEVCYYDDPEWIKDHLKPKPFKFDDNNPALIIPEKFKGNFARSVINPSFYSTINL